MNHLRLLNLFLMLLVASFYYSQEEKRLALVIGNASYEQGALKNPVNDALLMARTLDTLGFDVILDTNVETKKAFFSKIKEFGNKRPNYDVAFVYYAGHGVQINNQNYLLPTKEDFSSEDDVEQMGGISVQLIIKYLTAMTDQVNVLILDACRDNPFESNWDATRSLKGSGLAKMQAPSGSMIAFSTTAGNTAPDGRGENSIYCKVLAKNMLKEGVNLDQVFRNVRSEVKQLTNGKQLTEESTQLTGNTFYLVKKDLKPLYNEVEELIKNYKPLQAMKIIGKILSTDSSSKRAYYLKGSLYFQLNDTLNSLKSFNDAISIDINDPQSYFERGYCFNYFGYIDKALDDYNIAISLDSSKSIYFRKRGNLKLEKKEDFYGALSDYKSGLKIDSNSTILSNIGRLYDGYPFDLSDSAIFWFNLAIKTNPYDSYSYQNLAEFLYSQNKYNDALKNINKSIIIKKSIWGYAVKSDILLKMDSIDEAENAILNSIEFVNNNSNFISKGGISDYNSIYTRYKELAGKNFNEKIQIKKISTLISKYPDILSLHEIRAIFYEEQGEYDLALIDYSKCIDIDPENAAAYNNRADVYEELEKFDLALKDYAKAIELNNNEYSTWRAINNRALIYESQKKYELALKEYTKAIDLVKNPVNKAKSYRNRADVYAALEKFDLALADYNKAVETAPKEYNNYDYRADFYKTHGQYELALLDYSKCIDLMPENASVYNNRADAYKTLEKFDLALKDYAKVIKLNNHEYEIARAINNRALIYESQKKYELALKEYTKAIDLVKNPVNKAIAYRNRADVYAALEKFDLSLADYNKAVEVAPKNYYVYIYRAIFYEEQGEYDLALIDYSKCIDIDPENAAAYINRAKFHLRQKDYENAEKDFNNLIKIDKSNYGSYNERGLYYGLVGEYEKAYKDFEKSIQLDTTSRNVYYYRHKIFAKQGLVDKQKEDLLKTIQMDPKDPEGYYYLAILYEKQGSLFKAVKYYNKTISCLESPEGYYVSDDNGDAVPIYKIFLKIAELYKNEDERDLMCSEYRLALNSSEKFPNEKKKIEELIKANCK